jgi:outer membrane protein OmpA-like peptidoglycan-associated protein
MANLELSKQRPITVANYLIKNGINKNRIRTTGRGGQEPIAPNDTEANKSKNRRVEFVLE